MRLLDDDLAAESRYQALAPLPVSEDTLAALIRGLHDDSWRVRRLAADKLGAATSDTGLVIGELVKVLAERGTPGARNAAATALGKLGLLALPRLVQLLKEADADQRKFAAEILGEVGAPDAVPVLVAALQDVDPNVQAAAGEALSRIGGEQARVALDGLLTSTDVLLRVVGLEGLATLRAPPSLGELGHHLLDPATHDSALRLMGFVAHASAELLLCQALASASRTVALEALGARGQRLSTDAVTLLRALVRGPQAQRWLEDALLSENALVRRGALFVAAVSAEPKLAPVIAAAATGVDVELGQRVLLTLGPAGAAALLSGEVPCVVTLPRDARAVVEEVLVQLVDGSLVDLLTPTRQLGRR